MLRIVSKCSSTEEFVSIFRRFCDEESIFVVTRKPKSVGATPRFLITLADSEPMLVGQGEVVEAYQDKQNPFGRPGMRIRFTELDDNSRVVHQKLVEARAPAPLPPTPKPPPIPEDATAEEIKAAEQTAAAEAEALAQALEDQKKSGSNGEQRAPGGSTVLPANPFGDLTEASLEAFVECTMYEETSPNPLAGLIKSPEQVEAEGSGPIAHESVPPWWPKAEETSEVTDPTASPFNIEPTAPTPPPMDMTPPSIMAYQASSPAPVSEAQIGGLVEPTELVHYGRKPRPSWLVPVIAAGAASILTLLIGYAIWGGDDDKKPGAAMSSAAPAKATKSKASTKATKPKPANKAKKPAKAATEPGDDVKPATDTKPVPTPKPVGDDPAPAADTKPVADTKPPTPEPAAASDGDCTVTVTTRPSGAVVYAGSKRLGTTPIEAAALPCGTTTLRLRRVRYKKVRKVVKLRGGANEVKVNLKRPTHMIRVSSTPSRATVLVSGRRVGRTPVLTKVPGFERTSVKVIRSGYSSYSKRVYTGKKVTSVRARLKRKRRRR